MRQPSTISHADSLHRSATVSVCNREIVCNIKDSTAPQGVADPQDIARLSDWRDHVTLDDEPEPCIFDTVLSAAALLTLILASITASVFLTYAAWVYGPGLVSAALHQFGSVIHYFLPVG